jgi:predicted nucleotidyltransferase
MRPYEDRDFIKTVDGFYSCVVGYIHPPDRVISYIKYIPASGGRWGRGEKRYGRFLPDYTVPSLIENIRFLRENHPKYVFYSNVLNTTMSCCPVNMISEHYAPEIKLRELFENEKRDPLQEELVSLVEVISGGNYSSRAFGVTGSILTDIHRPEFSDIDLTIYGRRSSLEARKRLLNLYDSEGTRLRRLEGRELEAWCESKTRIYPLTRDEAEDIYRRKWNRGIFEGTLFSIHPVRLTEEITEAYGDRVFLPQGMMRVEATISDTSESMFLPCTYGVEDVNVLEGPRIECVREMTTYEGIYGDIFDPGEEVEALGKLERVVDNRFNEEYHRLLVGSLEAEGSDYIKPSIPRGTA